MVDVEFERRKQEILDECKIAPQVLDGLLPRLEKFMDPFVESLVRSEQVTHAQTFVQGLLSDLKNKNVESIAYRFGQERMPLQWFVGVPIGITNHCAIDWYFKSLRTWATMMVFWSLILRDFSNRDVNRLA